VVFQLSGAPVGIATVTRSPTVPTSADQVSVTLTTDAEPPAEQSFWLRYTTDGFASSRVVRMRGSATRYTTSIAAQPDKTPVTYYVFSSANTETLAPGDADLMTLTANTNSGANYRYTVAAGSAPIALTGARALWVDQDTLAWSGIAGASYKLIYDPDGDVSDSAESTPLVDANAPGFLDLVASGTIGAHAYPKNPNAHGLTRLTLPTGITAAQVKQLLKGQAVVASYDASGRRLDATGVQTQGVLDHLYVDNGTAAQATLGVSYSDHTPTVRVWAPTAKSVRLLRYTDASAPTATEEAMALDQASGVWSVSGEASWDRQFYLFDVEVYVPALDQVVHHRVTDPYALTLSTDSTDPADPRSQFVNLNDADLKPAGWDGLAKPALRAFEDIAIYEMHVRDFSINDGTVDPGERGTYLAFTYDGPGPDANPKLSNGMKHLLALQDAGLTHVHLLPAFDIASVPENGVPRTVSPAPVGFPRNSEQPQAAINASRATDGFNWGYDPYHYGAPEGSYSTNPNGTQRIFEFRRMVSALNQNGLRVVMDMVYNHTAAKDQEDKSVLGQVVPGYYHRYTTDSTLYQSSCCADTAAEYAMMEKLMIDTLLRWAKDYKVDGFRFDLMNLHTQQNMRHIKAALQGLTVTADGVDGSQIYLYGEGWDFGSAAEKGLTTCPHCYAKQHNMTGEGIGLFNDRIRDAAHGGFDQDPLQVHKQGFINGLGYDWNAYCYGGRDKSDLDRAADILRSSLRGSGTDWNGQGSPFTDDPQESVPYVEKHDNETLFDQNVFKLPHGPGDPGACGSDYVPPATSMAERVRAQNLGLSLIGLAQGVPFFHMGGDILRSKSLDRNSYDSGDWFNRVFWDYRGNNFGQGLPPAQDNGRRWGVMGPLLADTALDPSPADMEANAAHLREILRIRQSSPLFHLRTEADINARVTFFNTDNDPAALLVMGLDDGAIADDLDPAHEYLMPQPVG
jgi:pullulanase/glycogen debranching enzyme